MIEQFTARIIANDLDSIAIRIEALSAHPEYTKAGDMVRQAKTAVLAAATDLHHSEMKRRFANED